MVEKPNDNKRPLEISRQRRTDLVTNELTKMNDTVDVVLAFYYRKMKGIVETGQRPE